MALLDRSTCRNTNRQDMSLRRALIERSNVNNSGVPGLARRVQKEMDKLESPNTNTDPFTPRAATCLTPHSRADISATFGPVTTPNRNASARSNRPSGPHSKTPPVPCRLAYPDERVAPPSNYKTYCDARTEFLSNDMREEGICK